MPRHARNRRTTRRPLHRRPLQPHGAKHARHQKAPRAWRRVLLRPSFPLGLLALVVAALVVFPRVDAEERGRQEQVGMQISSAEYNRRDTVRRPKKKPKPARTTTTLQATTTTSAPAATVSDGTGDVGLLSKPGPSAAITCPAGAVSILPGQDIQAKINANEGSTTFCLRAGRHVPTTAYLNPGPSDVFIGEYGAVLDGQNTRAVSFSARHGSKPVTVKNLTIENFTQHGIEGAGGWTIENNEVRRNGGDGIRLGSVNRNNYVHHNDHGGMASGFGQSGIVVENNEIAFNNTDRVREEPDAGGKMVAVQGLDYRHNWIHDNYGNGIWCDIKCYGLDIHHNLVERNVKVGIEIEIGYDSQIHDNKLRGNGIVDSRCADGTKCWFTDLGGILVFDSANVRVYGNTIEDANGHGIVGRQDDRRRCDTGDPHTGRYCRGDHVVKNLQVYNNRIKAPTESRTYTFADGSRSPFVLAGLTGANDLSSDAYNNRFSSNSYQVPASPGLQANWYNWITDRAITWRSWQSVGLDAEGRISTY
jgi:Right handed beta helix region